MRKIDNISLDEVKRLNQEGWLLKDIAKKFNIASCDLGRHLKIKGVYMKSNRRKNVCNSAHG
jgi:hypothetical protein